eukprot:2157162-Amphidinium_carterae.1
MLVERRRNWVYWGFASLLPCRVQKKWIPTLLGDAEPRILLSTVFWVNCVSYTSPDRGLVAPTPRHSDNGRWLEVRSCAAKDASHFVNVGKRRVVYVVNCVLTLCVDATKATTISRANWPKRVKLPSQC